MRPRFRRAAALLLSLFPLCGICLALPAEPPGGDPFLQTVWTTEDGLPQNSVNDIIQGRDGYLWLATFGGLARFDGVRFTIFNSGNTPGLLSNRILSLHEDRDGTIWLTSQNGELMSFRDGVGRTLTAADGLPGASILGVEGTADGSLWVATMKGAARLRDGRVDVFTAADGLPHEHVWQIAEDRGGVVWAVTSGGLARFGGERFEPVDLGGDFPKGGTFALIAARDGGLRIATDHDVWSYAGGRPTRHANPLRERLEGVRTLFEDREGALWVGYNSPGELYRFRDGSFTRHATRPGGGELRVVHQDREGNMWVGTDGGGLVRMKRRLLAAYSVAEGLLSEGAKAVIDDGAGGMLATTSLGLTHWRADGGKVTYPEVNSALCRRRDGTLWAGSNRGLTRLESGSPVWYTSELGVQNPGVNALYEDRDGALWIGTVSGVSVLRGGRFETFTKSGGLVDDDVRYITQTRDGAMWFGTINGASRLAGGKFENFTIAQGLSNNFVRDIVEDADGSVWLGTYGGGLNRFRNGKFASVTTGKGLFDDFISRVLADGAGNFWMLGNRGIFRVAVAELHDVADGKARSVLSVSYGVEDGMLSSEGNGGVQPAGWKASDGRLWFPTIKGLVVVDPTGGNPLPPSVIVEAASVDGNSVGTGGGVRMEPGRENLEIEYTGISLARPEQVKFKYRMNGLDADWVDAGTRRRAYYPYLPPGEYTFQVIADNGDGVWNTQGASLSVTVLPPFYLTWWFFALCAVTAAGVAFLFYRVRVGAIRRQHAAELTFSRRLVDSQEEERKRFAAEMHDGLGQSLVIIKNRASLGLRQPGDPHAMAAHLESISESAAHALEETREIAFNLRPHLLDRLGLAKTIGSMVAKVSAASGIVFETRIDAIDGLIGKDSEILLYRIVQEAVSNVVKHSGAKRASVTIKHEGPRLIVRVADDGRGLAAETYRADTSRGGFGLIGMSERARLLNGRVHVDGEAGKGTAVTVEIDLDEHDGK